jgi:hypothetical protein
MWWNFCLVYLLQIVVIFITVIIINFIFGNNLLNGLKIALKLNLSDVTSKFCTVAMFEIVDS